MCYRTLSHASKDRSEGAAMGMVDLVDFWPVLLFWPAVALSVLALVAAHRAGTNCGSWEMGVDSWWRSVSLTAQSSIGIQRDHLELRVRPRVDRGRAGACRAFRRTRPCTQGRR